MNKSTKKSVLGGDLSTTTTYQAGVMQASVHRKLQKYCDEVLRPYGISKMQWLIIGTILDAGPAGVTITELAHKLDTGLPYLTNTLNLLQSKHIIERASNDDDSRAKMVTIADRYLDTATEIERVLRDKLRQTIYAHIDPSEFKIYMKVMYQLAGVDDSSQSQ